MPFSVTEEMLLEVLREAGEILSFRQAREQSRARVVHSVFCMCVRALVSFALTVAHAARLVTDKETGKPKGFGFCEYRDAETAASAVRNLNGRELHGRTMRVACETGASVVRVADRVRDACARSLAGRLC